MKLRHRLTLTFSIATATILLVSFGAAVFLVRRDRLHDLDQSLLTEAPLVGDSLFTRKERKSARGAPIPLYAALYAKDGRVLQASEGFTDVPSWSALDAAQLDEDRFLDLHNETTPLRGLLTVRPDGTTLLLAVSRRPLDDDLRLLYEVVGILFLLGLAATGGIAQLLGRRLANDVEQVAITARAVAAGDLRPQPSDGREFSDETLALRRDLDHMIAQLDAVMTAQRTFISHAAHELRSPLSTLRGELQLALRKPRDPEEYKHAVETILTDVESLIALSEDLLTLARVGESSLQERSPVGGVVSAAVRLAQGGATARSVTVATELQFDGVLVRGGSRDLARALRNLLDNAIAHSPIGATVRVTSEQSGAYLSIVVADAGPGVAEADRGQIFAPFYRGAREQETSGAGLGLAIARQIAQRHDGDVELLRSEPGETGARFALRLRLAE